MFVPVVILVMTVYRSHESFPVMLRRDYLTFLNCVLLSIAAAFLPLAVLNRFLLFGNYWLVLVLLGAGNIYFLILVTCCIRTLWGSGLAVAAGAAIVGLAATFGGLIAFLELGSFMYFFRRRSFCFTPIFCWARIFGPWARVFAHGNICGNSWISPQPTLGMPTRIINSD